MTIIPPQIADLPRKLMFIKEETSVSTNLQQTCQIIQLPKITDPRGNLSFIEGQKHIPFEIERVYWIYDSPGGEMREGRACQTLQEFIIAISGSFDVVFDDGQQQKICPLNRSYFGLYVPPMIWRRLENFSTNAFAFILSSQPFQEEDYIRNYDEFKRLKTRYDHY